MIGRIAFVVLGIAALLQGCAVAPAPGGPPVTRLEGTNWRVALVNSRATPVTGDYSMRFEAGRRFSARLGCNHMGGDYAVTGDLLTVRNLATTLMGCPEPAATFERDGTAVMAQPMRMAFTSNDRMMLSNGAGSIALDPQ